VLFLVANFWRENQRLFINMIGNLCATAPLLRWPAAHTPAEGSESSIGPGAPLPPTALGLFLELAHPIFRAPSLSAALGG